MQELRHQARLSQPRVAAHKNHAAALALQAGQGQRRELLHFLGPPHQGPAAGLGHRAFGQDAVRHQRPLLALDLDRRAGFGVEVVRHLLPGLRAHHHFAGLRQAPQARGGIDRVAGQREVARARIATPGNHQAALDAGVHGQDLAQAR